MLHVISSISWAVLLHAEYVRVTRELLPRLSDLKFPWICFHGEGDLWCLCRSCPVVCVAGFQTCCTFSTPG